MLKITSPPVAHISLRKIPRNQANETSRDSQTSWENSQEGKLTFSVYVLSEWNSHSKINTSEKYTANIFLWLCYSDLVTEKSCLTLCNHMNCSTPGFPVLHYLPEFIQTHVHWVSDAIQPSHPLLPPSPPSLNLSQHQGLFQWISSSHQVAKVLELQLQHQSF